jgi:hypothetical protein
MKPEKIQNNIFKKKNKRNKGGRGLVFGLEDLHEAVGDALAALDDGRFFED